MLMFRLARKTEKETVAMKVITFVTLLFLPGTFVSVSDGPPVRCVALTFEADIDEYRHIQVQSWRRWSRRESLFPGCDATFFHSIYSSDVLHFRPLWHLGLLEEIQ